MLRSWRTRFVGFFLLAALAAAPTREARAVDLKAGFARGDITPDRPVPLAGYGQRRNRPSKGVHDRVWCEAMALEVDGASYTVVSLDLLGIYAVVRDDLLARIDKKYGVTAENLLIAATNNHSGPGGVLDAQRLPGIRNVPALLKRFALQSLDDSTGSYDAALADGMLGVLAKTVEKAHDRKTAARIGFGRAQERRFNRNKVDINGPLDGDLNVMRVESTSGRLLGVVANYAITPSRVSWGALQITAEIPGFARAASRRALGESIGFLFFASGNTDAGYALKENPDEPEALPSGYDTVDEGPAKLDLSRAPEGTLPEADSIAKTFEHAAAIGDGLGGAIVDLVKRTKAGPVSRFEWRYARAAMPKGSGLYARFVPPETEFETIIVDKTILMTLPGRCTMPVAINLKKQARRLGFDQAWVICLANDYTGEFLHPAPYEKNYRRWSGPKSSAGYGPEVAPFIEETLLSPLGMRANSYAGELIDPSTAITGQGKAVNTGAKLITDLGRVQRSFDDLLRAV
ncbi:MAG: neutral/alkaline non-lysosomal ceramidase N-terminal domain-containing protein, partial [Planctomycetes bacterium]|nr:neutral/alkaline non-lysosomal ceramidase N-terminal domain-containing protein [Planctomycetota bacterium]